MGAANPPLGGPHAAPWINISIKSHFCIHNNIIELGHHIKRKEFDEERILRLMVIIAMIQSKTIDEIFTVFYCTSLFIFLENEWYVC